MGRRRVITRIVVIGTIIPFAWFTFIFISVYVAASSAQGRADEDPAPSGDAIVILGAAQYNGEPSPVLERRLDTVLELWAAGSAPKVVTTGSNQPGDIFTEGFAGFRYLRNNGIAEEKIIVVVDGGDTYESLLAAANQLADEERTILLVTDAYHAQRSADVASEVGFDATVVAAGDDTSLRRILRETVAVSVGRLVSYRRLSSWR